MSEDCESPSTESVSLREGERKDVDSHARANIEIIRQGERDGLLDEDEAEEAIDRIVAKDKEGDDE